VSVAKAWAHVLQSDIAVAQSTQAVLAVFKTLFVVDVLQVPVHVVAPAVVVHSVQSVIIAPHDSHPDLSNFTLKPVAQAVQVEAPEHAMQLVIEEQAAQVPPVAT